MSAVKDRRGELAYSRVAAVAVAVLIIDQLTKRLAVQSLEIGERKPFLPLIDVVRVRNEGIAFSSFAGMPWLVGLLVFLALVLLAGWFIRNRSLPLAWLAAGMVVGGAFGNIVDRVLEGAVVDFLKPPNWPAFNLADMAVVIGMIMLVVVVELDHRRSGSDRSPRSS